MKKNNVNSKMEELQLSYRKKLAFSNQIQENMEVSKHFINQDFSLSESYMLCKIDNIDSDCIRISTKNGNKYTVLLRPDANVGLGYYVQFGDDSYMSTMFSFNQLSPNMTIERCNEKLVLDGKKYDCIIKGAGEAIKEDSNKQIVNILDGSMIMLIQFNDTTNKIKPKQEFILKDVTYEVVGIDKHTYVYDNKGYISVTLQSVSSFNKDEGNDSEIGSGW